MPSFRLARASILPLLLAWLPCHADGFDILSRHDDLQNNLIIDTGDFEKITQTVSSIGTPDILKLKSNCFQPIGSISLWSYGKRAGMVLISKEKNLKVALLEAGIGSVKVQVTPVIQVACPTSDSDGLPVDLQQRLQEHKRRQGEMLRQLELLRRQRQ